MIPADAARETLREDMDRVLEFLRCHCTGFADCPVPHAAMDRICAALEAREPDTFQMAGDVLSGKRRIEDVLTELRPSTPTETPHD